MEYIKIPKIDKEVSKIGLGSWVFGGDNWMGSDENECVDVVHKALDSGINFIDTAPIYGDGRSESIIGKALAGRRDKVFLATKCGLKKEGNTVKICLKAEFLQEEIENSLKRLQTDCIDLYQVHWPDPNTSLNETFPQLRKFQKAGKIKYIGVSNFKLDLLKKTLPICDIVTLQNEYSIKKRAVEKELLPFCKAQNIGFLAYGSLAGGVLSGKYTNAPIFSPHDARSFFYGFSKEEKFKNIYPIIEVLQQLSKKYSKTVPQILLNWMVSRPISVVLVGARNINQLLDNVCSVGWSLEDQDIKTLEAVSA